MKNTLSCFFLLSLVVPLLASSVDNKVYIVYFGQHVNGEKALHEIEKFHLSYLHSVKESEEDAKSSLLYSYKHSINGFAAKLTSDEASKLSEMKEVLSVFPSHGKYSVHTTRSWEFVGLDEEDGHSSRKLKIGGEKLASRAKYGKDVIIGVMDSGVWPESPSFSDQGMDPVPKSWRGICQEGVAFNSFKCNRKIIGARYYVKGFEAEYGTVNATEDFLSPRDADGHGTHTASTAAGRQVSDVAALGGFAKGTASGGAPLARLSIYKACWAIPNQPKADGNTCFNSDMLAALDDAIADGVDIISVSIGTDEPVPFENDAIGLGALEASKRNILVVCSAGNNGPDPGTLTNPAPWIITVGASSVDRAFYASVKLRNGLSLQGPSITPNKLKKMYPLVYAGDVVVPGVARNLIGQCLPGSLDPTKVKGKIVVCITGAGLRVGKGLEVKRAGGVGFVLANSESDGDDIEYDAHFLPATTLSYDDGITILEYIYSTKNPMAKISPGKTKLNYKPAPFMAEFTSRGPNVVDPYILKPDITAPGLYILAAWSEASSPTKLPFDHRSVKYNLYSGTSMACPHVSGAAALLKAIHPRWSVAAIKSALMTTTVITNNLGNPITDSYGNDANPFQYGSGHFNPTKAVDPGLIYDATYNDYLLYLCAAGPDALIELGSTFKCPVNPPSTLTLNYPSFAIPNLVTTVTFTRTVTNIGRPKSTYLFSAEPPLGVDVKATPNILQFKRIGEKLSFNITVSPRYDVAGENSDYGFGWYSWDDGFYHVRSPMAVYLP
ncbi:Subtilase family protein isoform 2 [Hibiscus syriacus]|uniref:Subtilase family protein isoform 2 n=1 Tax=Hibiscus syriacus TaxID=106335 RepID=A0A6A3CH44_HIBSY|nr:subtilisin-like protease SBT5.6 [Hibiscus syriacus]KAE8728735.1 Subtilase family protein isoform 2 [Hibiscus syriacus]